MSADSTDLVLPFGIITHSVTGRGLERTQFSSFTNYVRILNRQWLEINTIPSADGLYLNQPVYLLNRNLFVFTTPANTTWNCRTWSVKVLGVSPHHKAVAASWQCQWTREVFKIPKNISQWKTKLAVVRRRLRIYLVIFNG